MRTILIGTVGSTAVVLRAMKAAGLPPSLLVTLAPALGRKRHDDYVDLSPMVDVGTDLLHIDQINEPAVLARILAEQADAIFVIGWSQIVGQALRAGAKRWCVGFHPTALPALRGRAAMGWTIALGLREGGASLFAIDDGVDTGDLLAQVRFPLDPRETLSGLGDKLMVALDGMIRDLLPRLADGTAVAIPQDGSGASYCARRTAADQLIDWTRSADEIDRLVRASGRPYAGAFSFTRKRRITIWSADPVEAEAPYHGFDGQVVFYRDGNPVIRCGDGRYLQLTDYQADDEAPLTGQVRLRSRPGHEWE